MNSLVVAAAVVDVCALCEVGDWDEDRVCHCLDGGTLAVFWVSSITCGRIYNVSISFLLRIHFEGVVLVRIERVVESCRKDGVEMDGGSFKAHGFTRKVYCTNVAGAVV